MQSPANNARMSVRPQAKAEAWVWAMAPGHSAPRLDQLATEEPLEIRLRAAGLARGGSELAVLPRRGGCALSARGVRFNVYSGSERVTGREMTHGQH
jgi:hypothetical protein